MRTTRFSRSAIALTTLALAAAAIAAPVAAQSPSAPAHDRRGQDARHHLARLRRPAGRQGGDRPFIAAAEARGYDTSLVDTNSDNAAINGEITTAVSQGVDGDRDRVRHPAGVR